MRIILLAFCFVICLGLSAQEPALAQTPDSVATYSSEINPPVELMEDEDVLLVPQYEEWEVSTLNGKLKMKGLPLSPSLRIFMEKDSLVEISVKAPFMGEVVRIVLNPDSVIGINKMNHTYTVARLHDFMKYYPGNLGDIQELLLNRVVFPGFGVIRDEIAELVDVYPQDNTFAVVPVEEASIEGVDYGYIVDEDFNPLVLLVLPAYADNAGFTLTYNYSNDNTDLKFAYQDGSKGMEVNLQLSSPEWKGEALKPINLDKKYKELPLGDFINYIGK